MRDERELGSCTGIKTFPVLFFCPRSSLFPHPFSRLLSILSWVEEVGLFPPDANNSPLTSKLSHVLRSVLGLLLWSPVLGVPGGQGNRGSYQRGLGNSCSPRSADSLAVLISNPLVWKMPRSCTLAGWMYRNIRTIEVHSGGSCGTGSTGDGCDLGQFVFLVCDLFS